MTAIELIFNIIIVILMVADTKGKKLIEWLIIVLTLFSAEIGIVLFIVWAFNKGWTQKYGVQQ